MIRPQINFKNMDITYKSELRFLGIYITENPKWNFFSNGATVKWARASSLLRLYNHTQTHLSVGLLWTTDQPDAETSI
jgi:hypothetical protein